MFASGVQQLQDLPPTALQLLCESSGGDIRSAVNGLQVLMAGNNPDTSLAGVSPLSSNDRKCQGGRVRSKQKLAATLPNAGFSRAASAAFAGLAGSVGRDPAVAIFSLIGRVLHNKRTGVVEGDSDRYGKTKRPDSAEAPFERPSRCDLEQSCGGASAETVVDLSGVQSDYGMDSSCKKSSRKQLGFVPEESLAKSGLCGESAVSFLHENLGPFFSEVEHLADSLSYISDADLLSTFKAGRSSDLELEGSGGGAGSRETIGGVYGYSVASRGILWSNRNVVSTYIPLRKPSWRRAAASAERIRYGARMVYLSCTSSQQEDSAYAGATSRSTLISQTIPFLALQVRYTTSSHQRQTPTWSQARDETNACPHLRLLSEFQQKWLRDASGTTAFAGLAVGPGMRLRSGFPGYHKSSSISNGGMADDVESGESEAELERWPTAPSTKQSGVSGAVGARDAAAAAVLADEGGKPARCKADDEDPIDDFPD